MKPVFKYKRPTAKNHGHTKIVLDGEIVGYFMPVRSKAAAVGHNWYLNIGSDVSMYFTNRKKLVQWIERLYQGVGR